jgi:hypothetical protein
MIEAVSLVDHEGIGADDGSGTGADTAAAGRTSTR